jgi:hypothetical protein
MVSIMPRKPTTHWDGEKLDLTDHDQNCAFVYGHLDSVDNVSEEISRYFIHILRNIGFNDVKVLEFLKNRKLSFEHLYGKFVPSNEEEGYMIFIEGNASGRGWFKFTKIQLDDEKSCLTCNNSYLIESKYDIKIKPCPIASQCLIPAESFPKWEEITRDNQESTIR